MKKKNKEYRKDDEVGSPDSKGATEDQVVKIRTIKGSETLGYPGEAREEHSGQNSPRRPTGPTGDLADNSTKNR